MMQITETSSDGLKREYKIVIGAAAIEQKVESKLAEVGQKANIPGFRPGKVPASLLKQRFGASVMGEVVEEIVNESAAKAMTDGDLKPAMQPKIEIDKFEEGADLEYTMSLEVMPEFEVTDLKALSATKYVVPVADKDVDEALGRLSENRKNSKPAAATKKAANGDVVVIDFLGKVDGEPFDGGAADGHYLELGSNSFIPGFEDQLVGVKKGDKKVVAVSFPKEYGAAHLAGKAAEFDVTVQEVRVPAPVEIDEEFAKSFGMESVDELKEKVREQLAQDFARLAKTRIKRELLDSLADSHDFDVPEGMVEQEFESIWKQYEQQKENGEIDAEDANKSEDELKAEYKDIAVRRVRLGLVLSSIGEKNKIEVSQEEVQRAVIEEAQRYPGQEREVLEYFQKNADALNSIRAPLYEDKVVDFVMELAKTTEKTVTVEDLVAAEESPADKPAKKESKAKGSKKAAADTKSASKSKPKAAKS